MKFDFVIGNPPYQEEAHGDNDYSSPVYDKFIDSAIGISHVVELIHPGRFLFKAGSTSKRWNEKMLNDNHFKILFYVPKSSNIFPNTDITGGIAISYYNANKSFEPIIFFTYHDKLKSIWTKAQPMIEKNKLKNIIYTQNKYNIDILLSEHPECKNEISGNGKDKRFRSNAFIKVSLFSKDKVNDNDIKVIGLVNNKRVWRYFPKKYVDSNHINLNKWKVLVPAGNGSGSIGEVLSTSIIGNPIVVPPSIAYTQTFIGIGAFDTETEANNAAKYIKTKFCRTMLGILKITQANNRDTWDCVPLQDFTPESDIDWSVSIAEIDKQLYKKYGLSDEEREFIETNVKEIK